MNTKSIYCIYPWERCNAELSATIQEWVAMHNGGHRTIGLTQMGKSLGELLLGASSSWEVDDEGSPTELKINQRGLLIMSIKMHPVCEIVETPKNQAE